MKLIRTKNYGEMSKTGAEIVIQEVKKNPCLAIGFATGKSVLGMYKNLTKAYKNKKIDFSRIKCFNLDEYYPIKKHNKKSFYYYLFKNFFNKVNVKKSNINLLNGETKNPEKECWNYEKKIIKNKIDLLILGVGINGHIAFNEPGSLKQSKTRLVELTSETKKINKINKNALTIGISAILKAKKIILLASGKSKADAVKHLLYGKENKKWPVSFLKKHGDLNVILDKKAGAS